MLRVKEERGMLLYCCCKEKVTQIFQRAIWLYLIKTKYIYLSFHRAISLLEIYPMNSHKTTVQRCLLVQHDLYQEKNERKEREKGGGREGGEQL